jgi:hypothetical protein
MTRVHRSDRPSKGGTAVTVAGDEVYGNEPGCGPSWSTAGSGTFLRSRRTTGSTPASGYDGRSIWPCGSRRAWQRLSPGRGAKGHRWYDWALADTDDRAADPHRTGRHWLLIRRKRRTGEMAFDRAHSAPRSRWPSWSGSPEPAGRSRNLPILQRTRRTRRTPTPPLDHLAPLDHPGHARPRVPIGHDRHPAPPGPDSKLIPLTRNEIRRLLTNLLTQTARTVRQILSWSRWRRRHQARARASHYRRQVASA